MRIAPAAATWAVVAAIAGCGGERATEAVAPRPSRQAAMISLSPASMTMRIGGGIAIAARVRDSAETPIGDAVVTWASSNSSVASVTTTGFVTAVSLGTATITAKSGALAATASITVYEPSVTTIRIGPAADTLLTEHHALLVAYTFDQADVPDPESVTWTSSDLAVATVDSSGRVSAVSPGIVVITATAGAAKASVGLTVVLGPPSASIAGDWTMTLSASPACRNQLPGVARDRQYSVHFTQQGADFRLTITSPTLEVANPGEDGGSLIGSTIGFTFIGDTGYDTWSYTDLHDHLGDGTTLDFDGVVTGVVSGSEIHATMSGDMELGPPSANGPIAICRATDHVVTLRR